MIFRFTAVGVTPLIMHNARLADPLDPYARELKRLSAKRQKTDDDYRRIAEVEMEGALYFTEPLGPYAPGSWFWRSLYDAAKETRNGPRVKKAVAIVTPENTLHYDGPRVLIKVIQDPTIQFRATAKVGMQRIVRTRPRFHGWSATAYGTLNESVMELADLQTIARTAGDHCGFGDWRPMHGRYAAEVEAVDAIPH